MCALLGRKMIGGVPEAQCDVEPGGQGVELPARSQERYVRTSDAVTAMLRDSVAG
jgi:hypothetical protein